VRGILLRRGLCQGRALGQIARHAGRLPTPACGRAGSRLRPWTSQAIQQLTQGALVSALGSVGCSMSDWQDPQRKKAFLRAYGLQQVGAAGGAGAASSSR